MSASVQNAPSSGQRKGMNGFNGFITGLLRSPLHGMVSGSFMLITVTGRKTGARYTTPVQYTRHDGQLLVLSHADRTWWKNLRGGAPVQVYLRRRTYPADATVTTDPDAVRAGIAQMMPKWSAEQRATFAPGKVIVTITLREPTA